MCSQAKQSLSAVVTAMEREMSSSTRGGNGKHSGEAQEQPNTKKRANNKPESNAAKGRERMKGRRTEVETPRATQLPCAFMQKQQQLFHF